MLSRLFRPPPPSPPAGWATYGVNPRKLDRQWREGRWHYMGGLPELARYSVIAGYIQFLHPDANILDVGCGEGLLIDRLGPGSYRRYHGIDISKEAIRQAQVKGFPDAAFTCAEAETFTTGERFDVIVFNEVLYYFVDPIPTLERYAGLLDPGGHCIGSMVMNERTTENWKVLEARFPCLDETVTKTKGAEWPWACRVWASPTERAGPA